MENERMPYLRAKARDLTLSPGVYLMKDKSGKIIYIGKAKILRNRVKSYFAKAARHTEKVAKMVSLVHDFDYIVTDSEFEALVLECSLIKQHSPKYNILLKDDKGYHYIKVTKERYPRISKSKTNNTDDTYIGPYTSGYSVTQSVDAANRAFMLPTCRKKFPEEFGKSRPCLNFHIKNCMGVCLGHVDEESYNERVRQALDYIKSGSTESVRLLTEQMEKASEALDFERAASIRDRIRAIERASEHQKIVAEGAGDRDVIACAQNEDATAFAVLKFRKGRLADKESFVFAGKENLQDARNEFVPRYYANIDDIPKLVCLDEALEDPELLQQFLRKKSGHAVQITVPQRGEQKKLVLMAMNNAAESLSQKAQRTGREIVALNELARALGLSAPPRYIEAYDISNLGDTGIVAGMVVFENGRPLKSAYKKFALKDMLVRDDYAAMSQVINRRLDRYESEKESGEGFGRLPDLILLDGGKGHVSTIEPILRARGYTLPVYGMVKDDKHRTRAIATDGGEISISSTRAAFTLVTAIQDEVHRFSITYQRKVRHKTMFESKLTTVRGVGEKKAAALMKQYKTKANLKTATIADLQKTAGIPEATAQALYDLIQEL